MALRHKAMKKRTGVPSLMEAFGVKEGPKKTMSVGGHEVDYGEPENEPEHSPLLKHMLKTAPGSGMPPPAGPKKDVSKGPEKIANPSRRSFLKGVGTGLGAAAAGMAATKVPSLVKAFTKGGKPSPGRFVSLQSSDPTAARKWRETYGHVLKDPANYGIDSSLGPVYKKALDSLRSGDPQAAFDERGAVFVPGEEGEWVAYIEPHGGLQGWFYYNPQTKKWSTTSPDFESDLVARASSEEAEALQRIWQPYEDHKASLPKP